MNVAVLSESQIKQVRSHPANVHPETCRGNFGKEVEVLGDRGPSELVSWAKTLEQIRCIRKLPEEWNREITRPSPEVCRAAELFVINVQRELGGNCQPPHVHPTPSGGIQFEWEGSGRYLEVEIVSPEVVEFYWRDNLAGEEKEDQLSTSEWANILPLIRRTTSGSTEK